MECRREVAADVSVNPDANIPIPNLPPDVLAQDERFWSRIRAEYGTGTLDFAHLEFGWYHPSANVVMRKEIETIQNGQRRGSHYKRGEMRADRESVRSALARLAGADREEGLTTKRENQQCTAECRGGSKDLDKEGGHDAREQDNTRQPPYPPCLMNQSQGFILSDR